MLISLRARVVAAALLLPWQCFAQTPTPYFYFDSSSYSETVTIKAALDDWQSESFQRGERQWSHNWVETGLRYQRWSLGVLARYDYDLRFSEDTATLYWQVSNEKDLASGDNLPLRVEANAFHAKGLRLAFFGDYGKLHYRIGGAYLQADYLVDGEITGRAHIISDKDYDFFAAVDYHYSEDYLFDRVVDEPEGDGLALDVALTYRFNDKVRLSLAVRDLYARIWWRDAPYTTGRANSLRKQYDDSGYVSVDPLLSGYEGIDSSYRQTLDPRGQATLRYKLTSTYAAHATYRYEYNHGLPALGVNRMTGDDANLYGRYWLDNEAVELGFRGRRLHVSLTADHSRFESLRTLWLKVSWGYGQ